MDAIFVNATLRGVQQRNLEASFLSVTIYVLVLGLGRLILLASLHGLTILLVPYF